MISVPSSEMARWHLLNPRSPVADSAPLEQAPPARPAAAEGAPARSTVVDLADEARRGGWARQALSVGLAGVIMQVVGHAQHAAASAADVRELTRRFGNEVVDLSQGTMTHTPAADALVNLGQILVVAAGGVFLFWLYRALVNARALGLSVRRDPWWDLIGFVVPVVNLWVPYQSMADLFDHGQRDRRLAARWWGFCLTGVLAVLALAPLGFAEPIVLAGTAGLAIALFAAAALSARTLIDRAHAFHVRLDAIARGEETAGPDRANSSPAEGGRTAVIPELALEVEWPDVSDEDFWARR